MSKPRYIDVNNIKFTGMTFKDVNNEVYFSLTDIRKAIEQTPTADVVEVRHGEWEIKSEIHQMLDDVDEELYVECPFCKRTFYVPYEFEDEKILAYARENYPYCNCGAKMDGERKGQK
jgi:hypothetical protein